MTIVDPFEGLSSLKDIPIECTECGHTVFMKMSAKSSDIKFLMICENCERKLKVESILGED